MFTSLDITHEIDHFWVIAILNNPCRYQRRLELFHAFMERLKRKGVKNVCVVEVAYGQRNFETTEYDVPLKIQLRSNTILWHKENMVNIGISRLPSNAKYVAWIDTDIGFVRDDWVEETIHKLQEYSVVQMYEDAIDLGPKGEIMKTAKSFVSCYKNKLPRMFDKKVDSYYHPTWNTGGVYWHPGYAWAATREAIDTLGGLFEVGIVGSGDHHMACCLVGQASWSLPKGISEDYESHVLNWQARANRLHRNIGYVPGTIYHFWHGKKTDRKYKERWSILIDNSFCPSSDIHHDSQGLITFPPDKIRLRDELRDYFYSRNEDSIDL